MKKYYKDMVESPENKYRGNFHDGCMRYLDARDAKTNQWPLASNKQYHLFVDVILKAFQVLAKVPVLDRKAFRKGKADPVDFSKELNGCGFMPTVRQVVQAPHIAAKKTTIVRHHAFSKKHNLPESILAWKMNMSFVRPDNRMLFVHGVVGHPTFCQVPILCDIPWKTVLLFR